METRIIIAYSIIAIMVVVMATGVSMFARSRKTRRDKASGRKKHTR